MVLVISAHKIIVLTTIKEYVLSPWENVMKDKYQFKMFVRIVLLIRDHLDTMFVIQIHAVQFKNFQKMANVKIVHHIKDNKVMENNVVQTHAIHYKNFWKMVNVKIVHHIRDNKVTVNNVDQIHAPQFKSFQKMVSVKIVQNMRDVKVMENNADQIHAVNYKSLLSMDHVKTVRNIIDNKISRLVALIFVPIH